MISKKMQDAINAQINAELYSWYLYHSMAAWFESVNLPGMAAWMKAQGGEERAHATKLYDYLVERGGRVKLDAIDAPPAEWKSPLAVFQAGYAHEQKVTGLINDLVALARQQKDNATEVFLQWFVGEQVEEEATASAIVEKLKMVGDSKPALLMLDHQLGARGKS